ncbi:unnamed protein product, partial [marine sediment metagenome]
GLKQICERGKIIVGMAPEYKPFEFKNKKGEIVGFDVDTAKKVAEILEVELEIKTYKWDKLMPALEKREIDIIISGMSRTLKRAKKVNFTDSYFKTGQVVLVSKKRANLGRYEELDKKGMRIGFVKKTTGEDVAKKYFKNVDIVPFDGETNATKALLKNKIDGFVIDKVFTDFFIKQNPDAKVLVGQLSKEDYCFAVCQGNSDLLIWLNYFIQESKSTGFFSTLYKRWFIEQAWK